MKSNKLKLKKSLLIDDYLKVLDLRSHKCMDESPEIYMHMDEEFIQAKKEGRPPQAQIHLFGSDSVEIIYLPSNKSGYRYALIENLPNLRELHVCLGNEFSLWSDRGELQWLICKGLPNLRVLTLEGDMKWLQLENMGSLKSINVSKCKRLDYFSIKNIPKLIRVNVKGCNKLRVVKDMTLEAQEFFGIYKQIELNQEKSKRNGRIYKNMTFTDIDLVLSKINQGTKLAFQKGLTEDYDPEDFLDCGIGLLKPLEYVNTEGTGESFSYVFYVRGLWKPRSSKRSNHSEPKVVCFWSRAEHNQESCLNSALDYLNGVLWINGKSLDKKRILSFLNQLIKKDSLSPK